MMLFLLSQDDHDLLLIDQPEDDLDSQTVYEEVVKLVRKIKPNRQFIFATHNANFPVLGDAEIVAACAYRKRFRSLPVASTRRRLKVKSSVSWEAVRKPSSAARPSTKSGMPPVSDFGIGRMSWT